LEEVQTGLRRWRRVRRLVWLPRQVVAVSAVLLGGDVDDDSEVAFGEAKAPAGAPGRSVRADLVPALTNGDGERALVDLLANPVRRIRRPWLRLVGTLERDGRGDLRWLPSAQARRWEAREVGFPASSLDLVEVLEVSQGMEALVLVVRQGGRTVFVLPAGKSDDLLGRRPGAALS
jgi:hypothetical protein